MGAWIETKVTLELKNFAVSPLAWGRGLKQGKEVEYLNSKESPLAWGRGLKQ